MSRIYSEKQEIPVCRLQEYLAEVRIVQEKFGRLTASQKDMAATLNRAAARLRTLGVTRG